MKEVFEGVEKELADLAKKYEGRPRKELVQLFLIAMEREELVTVSYRDRAMLERLENLDIPSDIKDLLRFSLVWVWRDEDMHSTYIRGAILKIGTPWLKFRAFSQQAAGAVAGWATSVLQHSKWTRTPFAFLGAKIVSSLGRLFGKVPKEIKHHLRKLPFRDFCKFNVEAEKTAWLCWDRIVKLTELDPDLPDTLAEDFNKVVEDEYRHEKIFNIWAKVLDENDHLLPGVTREQLEKEILEVSEHFLHRSARDINNIDHPIGSGGKVFVPFDREKKGKVPFFAESLEASDLAEKISIRAKYLGKPISEMKVAIKPTFMMGYHQKDRSPVTDPKVLQVLVDQLKVQGITGIKVLESQNLYDHFYKNRSVQEVGEYFGFEGEGYEMVNANDEFVDHYFERGMGQYTVSETWRDADFRICLSKLRSHPVEMAMLAIGNLEWLGSRCEDFIFLDRQADRSTNLMMLLDHFPPHYGILEGYDQLPDGLVGLMGCTKPKAAHRYYFAADCLALDQVASRHLQLRNFPDSSLLEAASHWFGGWSETVEVVGEDTEVKAWRTPVDNLWWAFLSFMSVPVYLLFSQRGAMFIPEMDEVAFPPKEKPGLWVRWGRSWNNRLIGLRFKG